VTTTAPIDGLETDYPDKLEIKNKENEQKPTIFCSCSENWNRDNIKQKNDK
jgi:hypothetical protein